MANEREKQVNDIGDRIAEGISRGMQELAPKRIKPGSSAFDPKSPFRSKRGPMLKGDVYQNGIKLNQEQLYDKEIELCNQITKSGRYINRLVEVRVSDDAGARVVLISYPDKGLDQRMENKNHWRNFLELVSLIVEQQGTVVLAEA
jgi:hypothetical protein